MNLEEKTIKLPIFDDKRLDKIEDVDQMMRVVERAFVTRKAVSPSYVAQLIHYKLSHGNFKGALNTTRKITDPYFRLDQQLRVYEFWAQTHPARLKDVSGTYLELSKIYQDDLTKNIYAELAREASEQASTKMRELRKEGRKRRLVGA